MVSNSSWVVFSKKNLKWTIISSDLKISKILLIKISLAFQQKSDSRIILDIILSICRLWRSSLWKYLARIVCPSKFLLSSGKSSSSYHWLRVVLVGSSLSMNISASVLWPFTWFSSEDFNSLIVIFLFWYGLHPYRHS